VSLAKSVAPTLADYGRKAVVTVVITNQGDEAYKPEIYNPYIVIERVINKSGSAPFNFRASRDGKIVANKREELSRILDKFQIHVDSPLTILTQDQARSFLSASDPSSLYKVRHDFRFPLTLVLYARYTSAIARQLLHEYSAEHRPPRATSHTH
jgi:hypothetical protein